MDEDVVAERKLLWVSGSSGGMQVLWSCRIVDRDKVEILWVSVRVYVVILLVRGDVHGIR